MSKDIQEHNVRLSIKRITVSAKEFENIEYGQVDVNVAFCYYQNSIIHLL